jgi:glycosyltransferase involved in cell wall biosynthesis
MSDSPLKISVVIPAYNEEAFIRQTLEALTAQADIDATAYEIIVVDNNCVDLTVEIAVSLGARIIKESKAGVGWARAAGFATANAPLIATTDADSVVPSNWLTSIIEAFGDEKVVAVGGPGTYDIKHDIMHAVVNRSLPYLHELDRLIHADTHHLVGFNMAVRRSAFEQVGGWHAELAIGEDLELSQRIATIGRIAFLPDLRVQTSDRRFQRVGPQQLMTYLGNYIEITHPGTAVRKQIEDLIERIRTTI